MMYQMKELSHISNYLFPSQSILNIQNNDNSCFLYSILAYFYYNIEKTHRTRSSTYEKYIDFKNQTAKLPDEKNT